MKTGDIIEHINKESKTGYPHDKIYTITSTDVRVKDPKTGEWYDGIEYAEGGIGTKYIREKKGFETHFKLAKK